MRGVSVRSQKRSCGFASLLKIADIQKPTPNQTFGCDLRIPESGHMFMRLVTAEIVTGFGRWRTKASSAGTRGPQALFYG